MKREPISLEITLVLMVLAALLACVVQLARVPEIPNARPLGVYQATPGHPLGEYQQAYFEFGDGTFRLWKIQPWLGRSIYFAIDVVPDFQSGHMKARIVGGQIGHMPIHPAVAPFMTGFFGPMLDKLPR